MKSVYFPFLVVCLTLSVLAFALPATWGTGIQPALHPDTNRLHRLNGLHYSEAYRAAGEYHYNAALWAVEQGITTGTPLSLNATCTRGQTVTFLYRDLVL